LFSIFGAVRNDNKVTRKSYPIMATMTATTSYVTADLNEIALSAINA